MGPPSSTSPATSDPCLVELTQAQTLLEEQQYAACIVACKDLLGKPRLSESTQIQVLVLWADATDDWYEAEEHRHDAERILGEMEMLLRGGGDTDTERTLDELRVLLDDVLRTQLESDPTKPALDAKGKIIEERDADDVIDAERGGSWYEPGELDAASQLALRVGKEEAERIYGVVVETISFEGAAGVEGSAAQAGKEKTSASEAAPPRLLLDDQAWMGSGVQRSGILRRSRSQIRGGLPTRPKDK